MITLLSAALAAPALPAASDLERAWAVDAVAVGRGEVPVSLGRADFEELAAGEVVVHRVDTPGGAFATGAVWLPVPIGAAWVAVQDQLDRPLGRAAAEERLPTNVPGVRRVYLRLDLPWPVNDRQWVAELTDDVALFEATDGRVWRRRWTLADPGLAPNPSPDAVWMEENTGSWTLLPAGGGTLCVLSVRSVPGGTLPKEITQTWAVRSLGGMLKTLARLAPGTMAHYREGHEPVLAPDGRQVPFGP